MSTLEDKAGHTTPTALQITLHERPSAHTSPCRLDGIGPSGIARVSRSTGSGCGDASVQPESETGDVPEVCRAVRPATGTTGVHTRTTNKKSRRGRGREEAETETRQRRDRDRQTLTETETEGSEDWRKACGDIKDTNEIKAIKDIKVEPPPLLTCRPLFGSYSLSFTVFLMIGV